ncbi:MAG: hypothetical protein KDB60_04120 [Propionibacteriaceae bacterium]|nr:hypothetical protein [Propionibacteriaceae bacterium]
MQAGYLVGKWIESKLKSMGTNAVIAWLASKIGQTLAKQMVTRVVQVGATAAASYIAALIGANGAIAGPLGFIIGLATGWL